MFTRKFWTHAAERALKTAAQFATTVIGTNFIDWTELDVVQIAGASATAGIVSILMSIGSARLSGPTDDPSLV